MTMTSGEIERMLVALESIAESQAHTARQTEAIAYMLGARSVNGLTIDYDCSNPMSWLTDSVERLIQAVRDK